MARVNYFFRNPVADQLRDEGRAEGRTVGRIEGRIEDRIEMTLEILESRGLQVPDWVRLRVESCADLDQLKVWSECAVLVVRAEDLFSDE
ncbi:hypothetical protein [Streptomyces sp. V3I7]|uniref:hypothetical protein n=1 Tax=Streptomyces sp. V3I7 TaxID=3042278 RepID=UPI0027885291|nr:hypothetical protein [Streptomyces sp. V3I7]MDQ0991385.1 putative transposase YdaD [Streptomyces sp. V3I7]